MGGKFHKNECECIMCHPAHGKSHHLYGTRRSKKLKILQSIKMTGRIRSKEYCKNISLSKRGTKNPMFGKSASKETIKKQRLGRQRVIKRRGFWMFDSGKKKISKMFKNKKKSIAHRKKIVKIVKTYWDKLPISIKNSRIKHMLLTSQLKPNKKEKLLFEIINAIYPGQYALNVKGKIIIDGMIPDIVNVNGQKKCIEHHGTYWHRNDHANRKINRYRKWGWKCLVVWEDELKKPNAVIKRVINFCENRRTHVTL